MTHLTIGQGMTYCSTSVEDQWFLNMRILYFILSCRKMLDIFPCTVNVTDSMVTEQALAVVHNYSA